MTSPDATSRTVNQIRAGMGRPKLWDKEALIMLLHDMAAEKGRVPRTTDFTGPDAPTTFSTFYRYFGSFTAALAAAGFDPDDPPPRWDGPAPTTGEEFRARELGTQRAREARQ